MKSSVLISFLVSGALTMAACSKQEPIPTQDGAGCMVSIGGKLEHVITRCGKPCASGGIPKGPCRLDPPLFKVELCSNECVINQDVALCMVGDQVASIFQMTDGRYWTLLSCEWPNYSSPTQTR